MGMNEPSRAEDFRVFARDHWAPLLRTAILLSGDRQLGEDLLQEALMRTYVAWERIEPGAVVAYTRLVMANACTDRWRRQRLNVVLMDEAKLSNQGSIDQHQIAFEDHEEIVERLATLNQRERTIIVLRYLWDLPEREVADQLGVSVGTVKSTASRALARLRAEAADGARSSR